MFVTFPRFWSHAICLFLSLENNLLSIAFNKTPSTMQHVQLNFFSSVTVNISVYLSHIVFFSFLLFQNYFSTDILNIYLSSDFISRVKEKKKETEWDKRFKQWSVDRTKVLWGKRILHLYMYCRKGKLTVEGKMCTSKWRQEERKQVRERLVAEFCLLLSFV